MDLKAIASILRKQAETQSTLVFDRTVLPVAVPDEVRTAYLLPPQHDLTVTGVAAGDIPDPRDGLLTIAPKAGSASVLNQTGVKVAVTFEQPQSDGPIQVVIVATMSAAWKFSDTFQGLESVFPFADLATSEVRFVYASSEQKKWAWPGDPSFLIELAQGLNFLSNVSFATFPLVAQVLNGLIGHESFKLYGPFAPTADQVLPVGELRAPLGLKKPFSIGVPPDALELSDPAVAVRIGASVPEQPLQPLDLAVVATFNDLLEIAVGLPMAGSVVAVDAKPLPNRNAIDAFIEKLPGGRNFRNYIPSLLSDIFAEVGLDGFLLAFDYSVGKVTRLGLSISTETPWIVIKDELELNSLKLSLQTIDPSGWNWLTVSIRASAAFLPKIFKGEFDFTVDLEKRSSWDVSAISGAFFGSVTLGDIVGGLLGKPDSVPSVLRDFWFSDFGVSAAPGSDEYSFFGSAEVALPIAGSELTAQLGLIVSTTKSDYEIHLRGQMAVGEEAFSLTLDLGKADSRLSANWQKTGAPLEFEDIAHAFGFDDVPAIPKELDLALTGASLTYDFTGKVLMLTAESQTYGDAVFIADTSDSSKPVYAFGIVVPLHVNFAEIPVVGSKFPDARNYGILEAGVWVLSREISTDEIGKINGYIAQAQHALPPDQILPVLPGGESLTALVLLSATLELGPGVTYPLTLPLGSTKTAVLPIDAMEAVTRAAETNGNVTPPVANPDGATWKDIQKTIGPLTVQRLGTKYAGGELYFLIDLGFSAGGLTIDLAGLGVSSPLTSFTPGFHLAGLEIAYEASAFQIAGEFLNMAVQPPTEFEYAGTATVEAGDFDLTALGSYARVTGHTSLFIFAVVEYPLGGPPYFFITGGAAGFGFNRSLLLPAVEEVSNFPLVAAAMNPKAVFPGGSNQTTSLSQALDVLEKYIPPTLGEYWLAAGIRFTSFEMLSSFALVSVAFGNRLEIALLGQSQLSLPADPTGKNPANDKIANVELTLEVGIDPGAGDFKASAALTSNSWILDKNCRLTGGFAFYVWWGGDHAGDFVITLGGYHPSYQPAKWYPSEPRLGFNWPFSESLTIHGGCYFALTPHAVMAGGGLQILFQYGGWLKAWLTAYIDFLIEWQPFFYEADAGILVGVSVRLSLFGLQTTLTLEIGATLYLSGPPFGGSATIHYWIISFTIPFGDQTRKAPPALSFDEFNQALMPKQAGGAQLPVRLMGAERDTPKQEPIFISPAIVSGLIGSPTSSKTLTMPIVAARTLEIQVTSSWPATGLTTTDAPPFYTYAGSLYARPMQSTNPFSGTLCVEVLYQNENHTDWFVLEPILKNAPTALWSKWDPGGPSVNPPTDKSGNPIVTIPQVPFGISLRAGDEKDCDPSAQMPLENLASEPVTVCVSWPGYPLPTPAQGGDALQRITETIVAPEVGATREKIRQRLKTAALPGSVMVNPDLSQRPGDLFAAPPEVANLGQLPQRDR